MARLLLAAALLGLVSAPVVADTYIGHATLPYRGPAAYVDKDSGIVVSVQTDGRHVSASAPDGRVLWTRDPSADAHLSRYRMAKPRIVDVYAPLPWMIAHRKGSFVAIQYENTQAGLLDLKSGDFLFLGQD